MNGYVVEMTNGGTDWCVRAARPSEMGDPENETLSLADACGFAARLATADGCRWYDMSSPEPRVGQTWRYNLGGRPVYVVAVDDRFVHVKRADESRVHLSNPAGAQTVGRLDMMENWTLVHDTETSS